MNFAVPVIVFIFSIGIGLASLYLLLGLYGYVHNHDHKEQIQYRNWVVYSVLSWFIMGILFYAVKDIFFGIPL